MTISGYLAFFIVVTLPSVLFLWLRQKWVDNRVKKLIASAELANELGQMTEEEWRSVVIEAKEATAELGNIPYFNLILFSFFANGLLGYLLSDAEARTISNSMSDLTSFTSVPWMYVERLLSSILF